MLPKELSYKVIEYNHHSMKGDLSRKQATLKLLADQLESKRDALKSLNNSLQSDLFYLLNNINIRHNNIDSTSANYKKAIAEMSSEELEEWYDRTYDLCLYAFMTLDQADRKSKMKELKDKIEK
jgi:peptidoglycan hydrolase CwlO-like protein